MALDKDKEGRISPVSFQKGSENRERTAKEWNQQEKQDRNRFTRLGKDWKHHLYPIKLFLNIEIAVLHHAVVSQFHSILLA